MMLIYTTIYIVTLLIEATAATIGLIFITIPRIILNEIARAMKRLLNIFRS